MSVSRPCDARFARIAFCFLRCFSLLSLRTSSSFCFAIFEASDSLAWAAGVNETNEIAQQSARVMMILNFVFVDLLI